HPRRVRRAGPGADGYRKDAGVLPAHDREPAKVVAAAGPWAPPARGHPRADPRAGQAGRQRDRVDDEKVPRRHRVRRHIDPGAALCAAQRRRLCGWHARARHRPDQPPEPAPGQRRVYLPGRGGPDAGHWLQGRHGKGAAGGQAAARRRLVPDAAVLGDRARVGQPGRARLYAGRPQKDRPDRVAKAQDQRDDHVHGHHDAVEDAPRRRGRPGRGARQGRAQHHLHRDKVGRQQAGHVVQVLRRRAGAARRHCAGAARADAAGLPQRHRPRADLHGRGSARAGHPRGRPGHQRGSAQGRRDVHPPQRPHGARGPLWHVHHVLWPCRPVVGRLHQEAHGRGLQADLGAAGPGHCQDHGRG
ncbi:hypothetical protein IWQ56_007151, partial [Coemansia nantahalensis]